MRQTISEGYITLNRQLHEARADYGANGKRWASFVNDVASGLGSKDILDYGCGKGSLSKSLPMLNVRNYDPSVPAFSDAPEPADIVTCTDVMEHIEPEMLGDVLDHIEELAKRTVFMVIATRPAVKTLPDGRNAHLIVQPYTWWLPVLWARWKIVQFTLINDGEFLVVMVPRADK